MKEYGGFLPIEINVQSEYYSTLNFPVLKVNSGRAAIYYALKEISPERIYIPYYICESVCDVIGKLGIEIIRYHILPDLTPGISLNNESDCILIVNYFGCMDSYIKRVSEKRSNLIIDNTQAFFSEPVLKEGIFNIYSCRKFIGVSDGGYLIAKGISMNKYSLESVCSGEFARFLLTSFEKGTNFAYEESIFNENHLKENFGGMSILTSALLSGADYKKIRDKREKNWSYLQKRLGKYNILSDITENIVPGYVYPFLIEKEIRGKLLKEKVYVSCLWKELLELRFEDTYEYFLSKYLIPLPIDQRYGEEEMNDLVDIILAKME